MTAKKIKTNGKRNNNNILKQFLLFSIFSSLSFSVLLFLDVLNYFILVICNLRSD